MEKIVDKFQIKEPIYIIDKNEIVYKSKIIIYLNIVDRYKHKTLLEFIFLFNIFCIFLDMLNYIIKLIKVSNNNFIIRILTNNKNIRIISLIHSILLLILCFITFIKLKIKTTLFY